MSKEYYLYVNGQRVKVSEQIYKVYWREKVFILAEMYRRSGGTDTAVPVEVYRQTGTGYRLHHSG